MAIRAPQVRVDVNIKGRNDSAKKAIDGTSKSLDGLSKGAEAAKNKASALAAQGEQTGGVLSRGFALAKNRVGEFGAGIAEAAAKMGPLGIAVAAAGVGAAIGAWAEKLAQVNLEQEKLVNATEAFTFRVKNSDEALKSARDATRGLFDDTQLQRVIIQFDRMKASVTEQYRALETATSLALEHGRSVAEVAPAVLKAYRGEAGELQDLLGVTIDVKNGSANLSKQLTELVVPVDAFTRSVRQQQQDVDNAASAARQLNGAWLTGQNLAAEYTKILDERNQRLIEGTQLKASVDVALLAEQEDRAAKATQRHADAVLRLTDAYRRQIEGIRELNGIVDQASKELERQEQRRKARWRARMKRIAAEKEARRKAFEAEIAQAQQSGREEVTRISGAIPKAQLENELLRLQIAKQMGGEFDEQILAQKERIALWEIELKLSAGQITQAEAELAIEKAQLQLQRERLSLRQGQEYIGPSREETEKLRSFAAGFEAVSDQLQSASLPDKFKAMTASVAAFGKSLEGQVNVDGAIAAIGALGQAVADDALAQSLIGVAIETARSIAAFARYDYGAGAAHALAAGAYVYSAAEAGGSASKPAATAAPGGAPTVQRGPSPEERLSSGRQLGGGSHTTNVYLSGTLVGSVQQLGAVIEDARRANRGTGFEAGRRV